MTTAELSPLFNHSVTFSVTATQLSSTVPTSDQFHLLFRLLDFLTSTSPDEPSSSTDHELISARMKAEWCLWEGYSKWDIGLNPFLGHFVEAWEARYANQQRQRERQQYGVHGDIIVVGIILSGQAKEVFSPRNMSSVDEDSWRI